MAHSITDYADTQGRSYTEGLSDEHRATHGHYLTPPAIARLMAKQLASGLDGSVVRLLDPAAGAGILACAVCEALADKLTPPSEIQLTCYEIDAGLRPILQKVLTTLEQAMRDKGIQLLVEMRFEDFVLANASALQQGLFSASAPFDAVISNPPYFKLAKSDPRAIACQTVVHGQPNIYGLFMAIAGAMLREGGRLNFIVPRSFASGPYFRLFREIFFAALKPEAIHVFNSRSDAFGRDEVLQENVILSARRETHWKGNNDVLVITASHGMRDLDRPEIFSVPLKEVLDLRSKDKVLCIPGSDDEVKVFHKLRHWQGNLHRHGWEISTGPVVPFRATDVIVNEPTQDTIPLLWMQNVKAMVTAWPAITRKSQYLVSCQESTAIVLPNRNYVLLRRFSAKEQDRRLTAAPVLARELPSKQVGLENHLNYIYKPSGALTEDEAIGLAALLNSRLLDNWFRAINGNTQVSATEIRSMPLPPVETIRAIGAEAKKILTLDAIDDLVEQMTAYEERIPVSA